jgi:hypothetical protein
VACGLWLAPVSAQRLLDRVVAIVNRAPITLSDVNAAIGLGLVETPASGDPIAAARVQLIDRQLILAEVARFAPPEPGEAAVDTEVAALRMRAGDRLDALMRDTGLDERRLREIARDSLRIRSYLDERFGTTGPINRDEAIAQWVTDLRMRAEITTPSPPARQP